MTRPRPGGLGGGDLDSPKSPGYIARNMRVVIDTNVLVTALRSPAGASAEVLRLAGDGELIALSSVALFLEYEAVLSRPEHLAACDLSVGDIRGFLGELARVIQPIEIHMLWRPRARDPDDDMVLEVAVNGGAAVIVTFNSRDLDVAARSFGVDVVTPRDLLRRL